MTQWVRRGLRTGIRTTAYPARPEVATGVSPGLPVGGSHSPSDIASLVSVCPTGALSRRGDSVVVDYRRCVHCLRCALRAEPIGWDPGYESAAASGGASGLPLAHAFRQSISIIVVDAGDCGACLHEVKLLNSPYYNMHRLGFFFTPTPRHADILLVVGPVTEHMRVALRKTWEAMPTPKRVVAVGACALSGGVFGPSFVTGSGVAEVIPVDVEVPGQPPPPLAILHGLLVSVGRKIPASLVSPAGTISAEGVAR